MIILRKLKIFARRDIFPESLRKVFSKNLETEKKYGGSYLNVELSNRYKDQYKSQPPGTCSIIDGVVKDIKSGYIFTDPEGKNTDPHYLSDFSNIKSNPPFVMFSKKINDEDRLNYKIYRPEIKILDGKEVYVQKVVLDTCIDHSISGSPGSYVRGQTGNTWKKRKKKAKKDRFKKK